MKKLCDENVALRPSNAARFLKCNLFTTLPQQPPNVKSKTLMAKGHKEHLRLHDGYFLKHEKQCEEFVDDIKQRCDEQVFRETPVTANLKGWEYRGTPDLYGFEAKKRTLHLVDYKTGSRKIFAQGNKQLLSYGVLVFMTHKDWKIEHLSLSILNTQHDHISTWKPSLKDLLMHAARLERSLRFTYEDKVYYSQKGDWCKWCSGKPWCPLWQGEKIAVAKGKEEEVTPQSVLRVLEMRMATLNNRLAKLGKYVSINSETGELEVSESDESK